jgi:hypothetical protein
LHKGECFSPLWWSFPHDSHCSKVSPLQAHWGRWRYTRLLWLPCLFTDHMGSALPPFSSGTFLMTTTVTSFPTPSLLGEGLHFCLLWLACLFTVLWGIAPLPVFSAQGTPLSLLHVFCCCCLLFCLVFFSFFPGWGSVCPGGYAELVQDCLWEYHLPLSSSGGLLLLSQ